ncbi:MAG: pantoate--beta-alanine ligase [Armatimonadetes bacterium]|nr:pantoate--beta-alanine ligase [Armatimonadota bacterium]
MRIIKPVADFPANSTIRTGFVPTMGALHEGHISLIKRSRSENDRTVVSIFVNPTQFGPNEDLSKYPRPFERDCEMASEAGADIVFAPSVEDVYKENSSKIQVPHVTELYEGAHRPGHFDGVATIVAKLFNIVTPNTAYFGEKDLQQCAVVTKLVEDLNFRIKIIFCDTIRENDGLAKSSRNTYLNEHDRLLAPCLHQALMQAKDDLLNGKKSSLTLKEQIEFLKSNSFNVDYFDLVDRSTMHPIRELNDNASLIVAAKLGTTRLIDNVRVIG